MMMVMMVIMVMVAIPGCQASTCEVVCNNQTAYHSTMLDNCNCREERRDGNIVNTAGQNRNPVRPGGYQRPVSHPTSSYSNPSASPYRPPVHQPAYRPPVQQYRPSSPPSYSYSSPSYSSGYPSQPAYTETQ